MDGLKQIEYYGKFDRSDIDNCYKELANPDEEVPPEFRTCPRCQLAQKGTITFVSAVGLQ